MSDARMAIDTSAETVERLAKRIKRDIDWRPGSLCADAAATFRALLDERDAMTAERDRLAAEVERLRFAKNLIRSLLTNDPDDIVADGGATVLMVWRHEAMRLFSEDEQAAIRAMLAAARAAEINARLDQEYRPNESRSEN